jgi:ectoine hydroxylase-related dioxygenase (phytanoyl-CoA dioxygenase family)
MTIEGAAVVPMTEQFEREGFVHIPSLGVTTADLTAARLVLDKLFDDFASLPEQFAHDLGGGQDRSRPVLPEINAVSTLAPQLRRSPVFAAAKRVATELLGPGTHLAYDHAIYKPAGAGGTTAWHQDSGYDPEDIPRLAIWIPFQDTRVEDGSMRYVPKSHLGGRQAHVTETRPSGKKVQRLPVDEAMAVDQPCDLGGAIAHHFHTAHGAGPNLGTDIRKAWILDFTRSAPAKRMVAWARDKAVTQKYKLR